ARVLGAPEPAARFVAGLAEQVDQLRVGVGELVVELPAQPGRERGAAPVRGDRDLQVSAPDDGGQRKRAVRRIVGGVDEHVGGAAVASDLGVHGGIVGGGEHESVRGGLAAPVLSLVPTYVGIVGQLGD